MSERIKLTNAPNLQATWRGVSPLEFSCNKLDPRSFLHKIRTDRGVKIRTYGNKTQGVNPRCHGASIQQTYEVRFDLENGYQRTRIRKWKRNQQQHLNCRDSCKQSCRVGTVYPEIPEEKQSIKFRAWALQLLTSSSSVGGAGKSSGMFSSTRVNTSQPISKFLPPNSFL